MKTAIYEAKRTRVTMMTMTEKNGRKIEYTSRKLVEEKERKTHSTHTHTHINVIPIAIGPEIEYMLFNDYY